jgi:hypothetical protein
METNLRPESFPGKSVIDWTEVVCHHIYLFPWQ